jgi:hypothetical protein
MIHPGAQRFADAADEFRRVVEHSPASTAELANRLTIALGRLVSAACELPDPGTQAGDLPPEEYAISDECELKVWDVCVSYLGPREYREYLEPFDMSGDGAPARPLLAYQVGTVYGGVIPGLRAWRTDTDAGRRHAIIEWKSGAVVWHRAAASALVALHHVLFR